MQSNNYTKRLAWVLIAVVLTAISAGIGLAYTESANNAMHSHVGMIQDKLQAARRMLDAATDRLTYLQFILISSDPFLQDEWAMEHRRLAASFAEARESLIALGLDAEEGRRMEDASLVIRLASQNQDIIREAAISGSIEEARGMLSADSFSIRHHLMEKLRELERYYLRQMDEANTTAREISILASRLLFGLTALILILIALFGLKVARRIWHQDQALRHEVWHRQEAQKTLEEHQENLQSMVEERTVELKRSEDRLKAILDTAPEAVITMSSDGLICGVNPAAETTFGYSAKEMLGKPVTLLMEDKYQAAHHAGLQRYVHTGEARLVGKSVEVEGLRKDGSVFPLELKIGVVRLDGKILFTGMMHDISERKMMQAQLIQAQKLESVGQLAAGIAHEINTPIQYISDNVLFLQESIAAMSSLVNIHQNCLELASRGKLDEQALAGIHEDTDALDLDFLSEESPKALAQSLDGLRKVASIVAAMKEFSHPGSRDAEQVDLNKLIQNTVIISCNEWKYVAEVLLLLQDDLPPIWGYQDRLGQVILNLVVNAAHAIAERAAPNRGLISVLTRLEGDRILIQVADTGCGVPQKIRNRIFDPFFTTKDVGKGTGQGLAIARSAVVDQHGGSLELEDDSSGGAVFSVYLPLSQQQREEAA